MKKINKTAWVFLTASIAAAAAGLILGEFRSVWEKAVMICLSCIGIG